jgi:hypothetical protein
VQWARSPRRCWSPRWAATGLGDNEMVYEMAASRDKDFTVVEGATHNLGRCTECETRKGEYENATKNFFNYVAKWIGTRF